MDSLSIPGLKSSSFSANSCVRASTMTTVALVDDRVEEDSDDGLAMRSIDDGRIMQGSEVTIRWCMSGRSVLAMTTKRDQSLSALIEYCRRQCALSENIPEVCVCLLWNPPVYIQHAARFGMQSTSILRPIRIAASLRTRRMPFDYAFHDKMQEDDNRCSVCYDACYDVHDSQLRLLRSTHAATFNCVRCPGRICVNCKVEVRKGDKMNVICLDCLRPEEILLLSETQTFRRSLVYELVRCDCPQPTDRMALLPGEKEYRCVECLNEHPVQSIDGE